MAKEQKDEGDPEHQKLQVDKMQRDEPFLSGSGNLLANCMISAQLRQVFASIRLAHSPRRVGQCRETEGGSGDNL